MPMIRLRMIALANTLGHVSGRFFKKNYRKKLIFKENNNVTITNTMNFLIFFLALALSVSAQIPIQAQNLVPKLQNSQQTNQVSTKEAKPKSVSRPSSFARLSPGKSEVQLESMIQVAQAENNANLVGPISRYAADLIRFQPHQQTGLMPGVFGSPINAFQIPTAFDAQSAFHAPNFQPGGYQNSLSFLPAPFHGSGTLNAALHSSATQLAPITVTHGTTQEEPQSQNLPVANFGGFTTTPEFGGGVYPQDRQSNSGFQISQDLPGTHFPVTILPTGNFAQSPILPSFQQVNAAIQPGQHWPNFFGQNQGNVAPYRFEKTRTPLVNTFQTIPAPIGTKTIYPNLPVSQENEPKRNEQSEEHDEEEESEEESDDEEEHHPESHEDDEEEEEEEESKPQSFQTSISNNWCDLNPLCKKQLKSSTDSVEQVTRVPVSDYWDHVRAPYQFPSADVGAHQSERNEQKTKQHYNKPKYNNNNNNNNNNNRPEKKEKELIPGYHHYNYELPEEFLKSFEETKEESKIIKTTNSPLINQMTTKKY